MGRPISYHDRSISLNRWLLYWLGAVAGSFAWGFVIGFVSKSLWEWLALLVVPAALAVVGYLFSVTERKSDRQAADRRAEVEREIAVGRARDVILQTYFDSL